MNIKDLKPNPRNPRKISDRKLELLKASIERFGDLSGFVFNRTTGRLFSGQQKQKVIPPDSTIKLTKEYEPATRAKTVADGYVLIDGERFKYREVEADETWEAEAMIAANKHGGEWDNDILKELIASTPNINIEFAGFEVAELGDINIPAPSYTAPEPEEVGKSESKEDEGELPEPPKVALSRPGDVWTLGNHHLMCGDSTKQADVDRLMTGYHVDLVFTDPPYGVAYVGKTEDALTIKNDKLSETELLSFLAAAFHEWRLKPGGSFYVCSPAGNLETVFRQALGNQLRQCMVWVKQTFVMGRQDYHWRHESILYGWKEGAGHYFKADRTQDTVWEFNKPSRNKEHPTMKPIELVEKAIVNSSKKGQIVFDGFLGSGTTLIACERTGRICYGIELDPIYVDVILDRFLNLTGKDPLRADGTSWMSLKKTPQNA